MNDTTFNKDAAPVAQQETQNSTPFNREAEDTLKSRIAWLIVNKPLYGTVFLYVNSIQTMALPTMAVGVTRVVDIALYYNPEFLMSLTKAESFAVLEHEAMHILLHHILRRKHYNHHPKLYNYGADMAINSYIAGLPEWAIFANKIGLPDNQSAEWYYASLKDKIKESGEGEDGEKGDGEGGVLSKAGRSVDDHSKWEDMQGDSDVIAEKIRGISKQAMKEQEKKANGWGDIPAGLVQEIIAANKPVVNWQKELRYFIYKTILVGKKNTRKRPNRRYGYQNPGVKKTLKSRIIVGVDTSGSVSDENLIEFFTELNGMNSHADVYVIQFDTQLYGKAELYDKKKKVVKVTGRGGTSFDPIIKFADDENYDGVIVLTDGYCSFPPEPKCSVMWGLTKETGNAVVPPYGKSVVIKKNNKG